MSEQESVARRPADDEQFEELYRRYATDVLRMCVFYLGDRQKAEDVTHDVYMKLYTARPVLQPGSEKAWLLKVALNRCKDVWRAAWLKRVVLGSPAMELIPAQSDMDDRLEREEVLKAIRRLPAEFREVVLLFYYQDRPIHEIADILGVPEGTVSSRLSRARKKLETLLKEE